MTVSAETENNITLDSQAIARGLDQQQFHDLPRNSRDVQGFLLLNPNVVGGFDDMQFLGSRTYGVSYIQGGQVSTNAIFGTIGNSAPGLDSVAEIQVLSNWYGAEYGGLAGVVVTTKRRRKHVHGTSFYDFNSDGLNALTYSQTLAGVERGDPLRHARASLGRQHGRPVRQETSCSSMPTTRDRTTRRSTAARVSTCRPGDAKWRFPRHVDQPKDRRPANRSPTR